MVELELPKLAVRVRFPSPAPPTSAGQRPGALPLRSRLAPSCPLRAHAPPLGCGSSACKPIKAGPAGGPVAPTDGLPPLMAAVGTAAHTGCMNSLGDTVLGLTYGQVRLVDSDPGWPRAFEALAAELRSALGEPAVAIEHVGSTAVAGLLAKPILDPAVGLAPDAEPDRVISAIERLGFVFRGDKGATPWTGLAHRPSCGCPHRPCHLVPIPSTMLRFVTVSHGHS
jgi:GrpB protein